MSKGIIWWVLVLGWLVAPAIAADEYEFDNVQRIVVVGDVHGAWPQFHELMQGVGIVDKQDQWVAGETHLVSLGDLVDRGADSRRVIEWLQQLEPQAQAAGGRVHVLLGNHELMNMSGDLRDVAEGEFVAWGGRTGHRQSFSLQGAAGAWLRNKPILLRINQSLFAHGGVSPELLPLGSIAEVNAHFAAHLSSLLEQGETLVADGVIPADTDFLYFSLPQDTPASPQVQAFAELSSATRNLVAFGGQGPLWYRGNAACHELLESTHVAQVLEQFSVDRIVVGHTPTVTRRVESRFDGQVVLADTGMLSSVYRGKPYALILEQGEVPFVLSANGEKSEVRVKGRNTAISAATPQDRLIFEKLSKRQAAKAVAAWRLSEWLGFDLVAPTAMAKAVDETSKQGVFVRSEALRSERERIDSNRQRPNYCNPWSDFDLVRVFDALTGMQQRSLVNLAYRRADWRIRLSKNQLAFKTSAKLPEYANPPILPPPAAERLRTLNAEQLSQLLGDLLKPSEIKAILTRRDQILEWPQSR